RPCMATTWELVVQSVAGGRVPMTLASSHFWRAVVTVRVYFADSEESARLQSRGSADALRGLPTASRALAVTTSRTKVRCRWRLRFIWLPRCELCVYEPGCWSCNAKIAEIRYSSGKKRGTTR